MNIYDAIRMLCLVLFLIQAAEAKNITPLVATFKNGHYEVRKSFFYDQCVCVFSSFAVVY